MGYQMAGCRPIQTLAECAKSGCNPLLTGRSALNRGERQLSYLANAHCVPQADIGDKFCERLLWLTRT